jgi:hypothetical protein
VTGTYDPELDLVYWGIGNPAPWNARARKGDNLFTNSIFAIRPKTGERVWYFQTNPNDPFDYDAVQTPIIATSNQLNGVSAKNGRIAGSPAIVDANVAALNPSQLAPRRFECPNRAAMLLHRVREGP